MGKIALISGGMGGIGKATANALAVAGYGVQILYHSSSSADAEVFIAGLPGTDHHAYACDLSDEAAIRKIIADIAKETGRIDVLIHTASERIVRESIDGMRTDTFRNQFDVSLFGAFTLFSAVLPTMKAQKSGLIVGITTSAIEAGSQSSRMSAYIASKFALRGLLRELTHEAKPSGIRVNAVAPNLLRTKLVDDLPERYFEWAAKADPRGRLTTPEEVAERTMFLLSPEGETATGKSLSVYPDTITDL